MGFFSRAARVVTKPIAKPLSRVSKPLLLAPKKLVSRVPKPLLATAAPIHAGGFLAGAAVKKDPLLALTAVSPVHGAFIDKRTRPYAIAATALVAAKYSGGASDAIVGQLKKGGKSDVADTVPPDVLEAQGQPTNKAGGGAAKLIIPAVLGVSALLLLKGGL